ncbi:unnamed protein product [Linum trigynum]|uniref:Uncharacterized protein n=1 Tax=Linum trigynum TaxID=586398 RepID=A0AAV2GP25_9ROSI
MTRSQSGGLLALDPELERTYRKIRRQQRARLAKEEVHLDGHLSSHSEEEYEMGDEHNKGNLNMGRNQPLGMPMSVPLVNQILGNNPVPPDRWGSTSTIPAESYYGVLLHSTSRRHPTRHPVSSHSSKQL